MMNWRLFLEFYGFCGSKFPGYFFFNRDYLHLQSFPRDFPKKWAIFPQIRFNFSKQLAFYKKQIVFIKKMYFFLTDVSRNRERIFCGKNRFSKKLNFCKKCFFLKCSKTKKINFLKKKNTINLLKEKRTNPFYNKKRLIFEKTLFFL